MSKLEDYIIRCYGCYYFQEVETQCIIASNSRSVLEIEDCEEFTCPKNCSCDTQPHEPLHCEIIPEELQVNFVEPYKYKTSETLKEEGS